MQIQFMIFNSYYFNRIPAINFAVILLEYNEQFLALVEKVSEKLVVENAEIKKILNLMSLIIYSSISQIN